MGDDLNLAEIFGEREGGGRGGGGGERGAPWRRQPVVSALSRFGYCSCCKREGGLNESVLESGPRIRGGSVTPPGLAHCISIGWSDLFHRGEVGDRGDGGGGVTDHSIWSNIFYSIQ